MYSAQEIIEISSDEDEEIGLRIPAETRAHSGRKRKEKDDSDDDLQPGASLDESNDDDCLILDGIPESVAAGSGCVELRDEMLDEMLIVGEKGQFACRDYPHPRYLCATFLFSMTPHRKHCDMCHCYVCDCPAPCIYWASHCSSTHKEQSWRVQRQLFRRRKREQQLTHHRFDVKPAFAGGLNPQTAKFSQSFSPADEAKSTRSDDPIQHFHVKPAMTDPNRPVSKSSSSLMSYEPKSVHHPQTIRCRRPLHISTETAASRPKDILCEIYKNCPTVISCRRRIPPSLQPDEPSDTDKDD